MAIGDFRLKGIQEAGQTAPQGHVDMSHLDDFGGMGSGSDDPMNNPEHQAALAKAKAWEDQVVNSPGGEGDNDDDNDNDDDEDWYNLFVSIVISQWLKRKNLPIRS